MKFFVTEKAKADIRRITGYIAVDNPRAADRLLGRFRERFLEIRSHPHANAYAQGFEYFQIRRKVFGSYLIFYRVGRAQIEVLHVLHGAMDLSAILTDDA